MDLFAKTEGQHNYDIAREQGVYPYFHELTSGQDTVVQMEGHRTIMIGSNNYLGLTSEPEVIKAGIDALNKYGTGCSGSRFLNGTLDIHVQFEKELAEFLNKDAVLTFSTGFQSNLGIISAIVGRNDVILCDKENHASVYDGCRLSYGRMVRYEHSDMLDLESKLKEIKLTDIVRDEEQPRREFSTEALEALASSIKEHGVLQPIVVTKEEDKYNI